MIRLRTGALPLRSGRPEGAHVTELAAASVVHFYDTRTHAILCGLHGANHRSTKHPRGVTCHACVGLLGHRSAPQDEAAPTPSTGAN